MLRTLALFSLGAIVAAPSALAQTTFLSQSGLVVVEIESAATVDDWNESTVTPGWLTDGYFRWDGPNLFNQPGASGIFGFNFEIQQGGDWLLRLRNRHENPDPTEENDVWIRMDGGSWIKTFSNQAGSVGAWTWESRFDLPSGSQPQASYNLTPGQHRIEFSGRSFGFKMDRFHLHLPGHPGATDPNLTESPRRFGNNYCPAAPNSTGQPATITATGSPRIEQNNLILTGMNLPPNTPGYFLVSRDAGLIVAPPGSTGNLCLGGAIGRYSNFIRNAGGAGNLSFRVDLNAIAQPGGPVAVSAGDTWRFQLWYRDSSPTGGTSNFTRAIELSFI